MYSSRHGSRINTDKFLNERLRCAQASSRVREHALPGNCLDFNSLNSSFLGFLVIQTGYWPVPFSSRFLHKALRSADYIIKVNFHVVDMDQSESFQSTDLNWECGFFFFFFYQNHLFRRI